MRHQLRDYPIDLLVNLRCILHTAGYDQGRSRLIDQDGVHLVDNGIVQQPLDLLFQAKGNVVTKIIESKLIVGAVGDIGLVG